jgi:hypothetical protein
LQKAPAYDLLSIVSETEVSVANIIKAHRVGDRADFGVNDQGSIFLLRSYTDVARDWIDENIGDFAQWWCGALVVEHRYIDNIIAGLQGDGLTVEFE